MCFLWDLHCHYKKIETTIRALYKTRSTEKKHGRENLA